MSHIIKKDDVLKRIYFIVKLIQNQKQSTMQGALTSKSDSMGGIFDRFINSIAEDVAFEKILIPKLKSSKKIKVLKDYYLYNPSSSAAGIAPDIFGINVEGKKINFVEFNDKWQAVQGMPQIEVKTFKKKNQMISLRNQDYDNEFLILVDLDLRIDYLVPFLNKTILNKELWEEMHMDDSLFIKKDSNNQIKQIDQVDYGSDDIGNIDLISVTKGKDFITQTTFCGPRISPKRIKNIEERSKCSCNLNLTFSSFLHQSPRLDQLMEFNDSWYDLTKTNKNSILYLDIWTINAEKLIVCKVNKNSVIIRPISNDCAINGVKLNKDIFYSINFLVLDRSSNDGEEYFIQKDCAHLLKNSEAELLKLFAKIIN